MQCVEPVSIRTVSEVHAPGAASSPLANSENHTRNGLSMWTRYRKWKHLLIPSLVFFALFLMRGEPDDSAGRNVGIGIAVLLGRGISPRRPFGSLRIGDDPVQSVDIDSPQSRSVFAFAVPTGAL